MALVHPGTTIPTADLSIRDGRKRHRLRCDLCLANKKGCFIYEGEAACERCQSKRVACRSAQKPLEVQLTRNFEGIGPRETLKDEEIPVGLEIVGTEEGARTKAKSNSMTHSSRKFNKDRGRSRAQAQGFTQPSSTHSVSGKSRPQQFSAQQGQPDNMSSHHATSSRIDTHHAKDMSEKITQEPPLQQSIYTHPSHIVIFPCAVVNGRATYQGYDQPTPNPLVNGTKYTYYPLINSIPLELQNPRLQAVPPQVRQSVQGGYAPIHSSPLKNPPLSQDFYTTTSPDSQRLSLDPIMCCKEAALTESRSKLSTLGIDRHIKIMEAWAMVNRGRRPVDFDERQDSSIWLAYNRIISILAFPLGGNPNLQLTRTMIGTNSITGQDNYDLRNDPNIVPDPKVITRFELHEYQGGGMKDDNKGKDCFVRLSAGAELWCPVHEYRFTVNEYKYYAPYVSPDSAVTEESQKLVLKKNDFEMTHGVKRKASDRFDADEVKIRNYQDQGNDQAKFANPSSKPFDRGATSVLNHPDGCPPLRSECLPSAHEIAAHRAAESSNQSLFDRISGDLTTDWNSPLFVAKNWAKERGFTYTPATEDGTTGTLIAPQSAYELARNNHSGPGDSSATSDKPGTIENTQSKELQ